MVSVTYPRRAQKKIFLRVFMETERGKEGDSAQMIGQME